MEPGREQERGIRPSTGHGAGSEALPGGSPIRVLIVEDNRLDALLMIEQLERVGYKPQWRCVETEAGFLAGLTEAPDIILSDSNLPQFRALAAQSVLHECGLDIPFLLVSGSALSGEGVEVLRRGGSGYVSKKDLESLGEMVRETLGRDSSRARAAVWIVDEGPDRGKAFAFCLRGMEYRTHVFESLEAALAALGSAVAPPVLLIADLGWWGYETVDLLRRFEEMAPKTKLMVVENGCAREDGAAVVTGSRVVLSKPFGYQELLSAVQKTLET